MFQDADVPTLTFTEQKEVAQSWLNDGITVVSRRLTKSKMGKGISIITPDMDLPQVLLYTQYYEKTHEFRVHVFDGKIIDYVQKKKMGKAKRESLELDKVNMEVRNHKKGWVFARKDIHASKKINDLGLAAVKAVGLDFGAVDILAKFNRSGELLSALVCEVNSAPGMSDVNTFNAYTSAIERYMKSWYKQGDLQSSPDFIE